MESAANEQPSWLATAVAEARATLDADPEGNLDWRAIRRLWLWMYESSVHAPFRRGLSHFLIGCGILGDSNGDPQVSEEHRSILIHALECSRVVLLDEQFTSNGRRDLRDLASHAESEFNRLSLATGDSTDLDRRYLPLAYAWTSLYSLDHLAIDDFSEETAQADVPQPECVACAFYTNYPGRNAVDPAMVRDFWQWWLDRILTVCAGPVTTCLQRVRTIQPAQDDMRPFAFDPRR